MAGQPEDRPSRGTFRLEAFSDGVIAIAITLLIIEVGVPHVDADESLGNALWEQWPSYFGFVLSFATIGIMWMNHHEMFRDIEHVDHSVMVLNLLLLMSISFLPFPTAVLAEYLQDDNRRLTATLLYGGSLTSTAICFNVLRLYVSLVPGLLDSRVSVQRIRQRARRYPIGPILYGLGLPLALISPWITLTLYALLAIFYALPQAET